MGIAVQGPREETDAFVDDAGHRDDGRPGERRPLVEDRERVAGDDDEVRPVADHGGQGPVEDGRPR